jgi:hypothetical protein
MTKRKNFDLPKHLQPEGRREAQRLQNAAIQKWASDRGLGTRPQTFAEINTGPVKSQKNIKR